MAAFARGGCRLLCSVSRHTFKSGHIHSRRINSLTASALLNITSKKSIASFQEACPLPVNKFDLNGSGIISTSSVCFSTAFQSQAEELSQSEDDSEVTKENRWPAPVDLTQVARTKQQNPKFRKEVGIINHPHTLHFSGYGWNLSIDSLEAAFGRFGELIEVKIPLKSVYDSNTDTNNIDKEYRYGFVSFEKEESMKKVLEQKEFTINNHKLIMNPKVPSEIERTITLQNLPSDITVDKIHNIMANYGDVELINVIFYESLLNSSKKEVEGNVENATMKPNYAYVRFESSYQSNKVSENPPFFGNVQSAISRPKKKVQWKDRANKVMLEGLPDQVDTTILTKYLETHAPVKQAVILTNKETGLSKGIAIAEFFNLKDVSDLVSKGKHEILQTQILVRALGLCNI